MTLGSTYCVDTCPPGTKQGKAFELDFLEVPQTFKIVIDAELPVQDTSDAIEVLGWTAAPTVGGSQKVRITTLPKSGGLATFNPTAYRWISVSARNTGNSNLYDGCCMSVEGSTIRLHSF